MSTPAVNRTDYLTLNLPTYRLVGGNWSVWANQSYHAGLTRDQRPKSVNNPVNPSKWRNPSAWNHLFAQVSCDPAQTVQYIKNDFTDGWLVPVFPSFDNIPSLIPAPSSQVVQSAVSQALSQLKNEKVDLASDIYEWRQSASLLTETVTRIANTVKLFRRRSPKLWGQVIKNGLRNEWHNVPDEWLKIQYGWKPGMADTFSSCSALSTDAKAYDARVSGFAKDQAAHLVDQNSGFPFGPGHNQIRKDYVNRVSSKVILYYYMDNPLLVSLSSLGLTNPVDLVWEELKFSFVVDWFLPIGNWLQTWDAGLGWRFKSGTRTDYGSAIGRWYYIYNNVDPGWHILGPTSLGSFRSFNVSRVVYTSQPGVGLPHFKNPFTSTHIAEGLSLLVNAFR